MNMVYAKFAKMAKVEIFSRFMYDHGFQDWARGAPLTANGFPHKAHHLMRDMSC
jgi:hypothetical protein